MRPEQETLFKNIIPNHFVETENKYKDILDDEINKFNDRRLRNLRLRQERINKNKVETKLKTNDFVVIKAYGDILKTKISL